MRLKVVLDMCSGNLAKSFKNDAVKKVFSVKFQIEITQRKTFHIFTDSTTHITQRKSSEYI